MDRRTQAVVENISVALQGVPTPVISEATGLPAARIDDVRHGRTEPMMSDLLKVGGFLRIPAESLLEGAA